MLKNAPAIATAAELFDVLWLLINVISQQLKSNGEWSTCN
jgi:hypothetical protein